MITGKNFAITTANLVRHEWLGLDCRVQTSTDAGRTGLRGRIIDETKNTLVVSTAKGPKTLPKAECTFAFALGAEMAVIQGKNACLTGIERIRLAGPATPKKWLA